MPRKKSNQDENNIEIQDEIVEKPKRQASERQLQHLNNIREKAKQAKAENKKIVSTVKSYKNNNPQPSPDYSALKNDISLIKQYLSNEELRRSEKAKNKQLAKEAVDRQTYQEYQEPVDNIFR